jgi:hypothetical protein
VQATKGNFWAVNVDLAMHEAVDDWIAKEE